MSNSIQNITKYLNVQQQVYLNSLTSNYNMLTNPVYQQAFLSQCQMIPIHSLINDIYMKNSQFQQALYINLIKNYQKSISDINSNFCFGNSDSLSHKNDNIYEKTMTINNCSSPLIDCKSKSSIISCNEITQPNSNAKKNTCLKKKKKRSGNVDHPRYSDEFANVEDKKSTSLTFAENNLKYKLKINKRTKAVVNQIYDEKICLMGTKEEYEKFFKNDNSLLTEVELNLINMIDKPRKGKKKSHQNSFICLGKEISLRLKEEIKEYAPFYEKELEKLKLNKFHCFMIKHFPEMYKLNNFYIFIKQNTIRKSQLESKNLTQNKQDIITINEEKNEQFIKKVWESNKIDDSKSQEFLFSIEKVWPLKDYKFCQELSLELFKMNNFDYEHTKSKIINVDDEFKTLVNDRYRFLELNPLNLNFHSKN